jgi:hypothetical protein
MGNYATIRILVNGLSGQPSKTCIDPDLEWIYKLLDLFFFPLKLTAWGTGVRPGQVRTRN